MSQNKKSSFYIQGSILALAGIITKIIGFIYRIPMANFLGNQGNGIYSVAFSIYGIALTLSSYSLPLAVSKLVSARLVRHEYKNVKAILMNALTFATIVGAIASLILFFGADVLESLYETPGLAKPLRILAPTVFVVSFLGVFRGFFQGQGTMVPTAISQVIEQIINAIVSILAAWQFTRIYQNNDYVAAYGATGGTLGTLIGALAGLFFLLFTFYAYKPVFAKSLRKQKTPVERNEDLMKALIMTVIPVIISQTIYQIGYTLDALLFGKLMAFKGTDSDFTTSLQGVYSTQYNQLINLPVAIATAMASSTIPSIVRSNSSGNHEEVRHKTNGVIKFNMVIAFPCAIGLSVMAYPITHSLYPRLVEFESYSVPLLQFGSLAVVFYALSTITTAILQGNNYMKIPVIHSAISLIIHLIVTAALLAFTNLGVYALMIGNVLFPLIVCILNCRSLSRYLHFKFHYMELFGKPAIASVFMGLAAFITYQLAHLILPLSIAMIVAILVAVVIYFVVIGVIRCFRYDELLELPMGRKLASILYKGNMRRW